MHIQPNSKLLFIGDSITDYERARPVGEGLFEAPWQGLYELGGWLSDGPLSGVSDPVGEHEYQRQHGL